MLAGQGAPRAGPSNLWSDRGTYVTGGLLLVATALAWAAVLWPTLSMQPAGSADTMGSPGMASGTLVATDLVAYLVAWGVMMAAMMLPSALPMFVVYRAVARNGKRTGQVGLPATIFALTYLVLWLACGVPVFAAGLLLERAGTAIPLLADLLPRAVAVVLVLAGLYQYSPLKQSCLRSCQSPLGFLLGNWRSGYLGSLKLGLKHAGICVGCCLGLMIVLITAGAMSLPWMLLIATLIFAEKVIPRGDRTARISGAILVALGLVVLIQPDLAMLFRGGGMS